MIASKPPRRPYNSSRRRQGAQLTRQAIGQAAFKLFIERGYCGASIDSIAEEAAVAPETIYATFGSKREILHYLLDISVGGDEAKVGVLDRPEQQAVLRETDLGRFLAGFCDGVSRILSRAAPVFIILAEAAKTERDLAVLQNRVRKERLENMTRVAHAIARLTSLRVDEAQAAETIWTLTSPEIYFLLTTVREWSREKYAAWLQDSLSRLLFH